MKKFKILLCSLLGLCFLNGCSVGALQPIESIPTPNTSVSNTSNGNATSEEIEDDEVFCNGIKIDYTGSKTITSGKTINLSASLSFTDGTPSSEAQIVEWEGKSNTGGMTFQITPNGNSCIVEFIKFSGSNAPESKTITITAKNNYTESGDYVTDSITFTVLRYQESNDSVDQSNLPIVNSINNNQWGWDGISSWTFIAKNLKGDYNVTVKYTSKTNSNENTNPYAHTLSIVEEQLADGANGYGSVWVNRLDWWMWCDQWQSSSKLTEQADNGGTDAVNKICWTGNGVNEDYYNTYADCTVELTFIRTGKTVRNEYVITSNTTGKSYNYWAQITDVDTSKNLSLALVAECATFTITSIEFNKVTYA